ncbi:hypothetical protein CC1G_08812 [Coprinopsis cinerea okayama7|uniref:Uncharacterized protein n=1 Tax=Coprinopsis cinerea (strain Okayama-7 / 130 / ATCC MYA-4618 / FGSC 9003) TaxID=240176 RepID=A8N462_COPC7|nr:hypothetical protein CC1G_08812 [Coprinopsis cinerea okayama7\|eukprot:XP_001829657.2 hypothetical protein CC1G_08812 [Coprinopsis cinerea okayama7\
MSNGVRIINWTSYDPRDPTTRICPPSIFKYVLLLPNRRILLMGYNVSIWDWEQGRRLVAENSPDAWSTPDWESSDLFDPPHPFTSPFYIRGSIRLVLVGTDDVILGVIIPTDMGKRAPSDVSLVRLLEAPTSLGHTTRWFGYRKGAYLAKDSDSLVCYKWPDDDLPPHSHQSIRLPGQCGDMASCFQVDGDYRSLVAFSFKSPPSCTVFG